jgi:hypothetical protein
MEFAQNLASGMQHEGTKTQRKTAKIKATWSLPDGASNARVSHDELQMLGRLVGVLG